MKPNKLKQVELRFIHIIERVYRTIDGFQFSMPIGLTRRGEVYEFDGDGWKRLPMLETSAAEITKD